MMIRDQMSHPYQGFQGKRWQQRIAAGVMLLLILNYYRKKYGEKMCFQQWVTGWAYTATGADPIAYLIPVQVVK